MRDVLIILFGLACIPVPLADAFRGLLIYCLWSFMKPQSLAWGPTAREGRFTFFIAIFLLARAWAATAGPKIRIKGPAVWFLMFWLWMAVSAWLSPHRVYAMVFVTKFSKIAMAMILITGLVRTRKQLRSLLMVMAWCAGFYAIKLGLYLLTTSARTHHGGPMGLDNNDTALFITIGLPLLVYLAPQIENVWARRMTYFAAFMSIPAVVVGGSRGGMLALATAWGLILWRKFGLAKGILLGIMGLMLVIPFVPQETYDRYLTLQNHEEDASARGRLWAWETATNMANARPWTGFGVGRQAFMAEYDRYKTHVEDKPHVAHSVWFTTLASMGYIGLVLYVGMMLSALRRCWRTRKLAKQFPGKTGAWVRQYGEMIFVSLAAFCIGATFLSQMGLEYLYGIVLLSVPLLEIARRELEAGPEQSPESEFSGLPAATRKRLRQLDEGYEEAARRRRRMMPGRTTA
ncbi:MAG: putative O-glycosylation ligase, exosortase A system-associated [Phycisphaerales bacterium]|jgi:putative inorganic carbon (hco3(-)) transporter|nr:putative O-glycosylation ligase, exosortase A system-associated [Phycisphaerales bacterium]MBT7170868.1 putative O-glycosylation ligase, exosortase A system-associated [Phycisphaerales bacterium]